MQTNTKILKTTKDKIIVISLKELVPLTIDRISLSGPIIGNANE